MSNPDLDLTEKVAGAMADAGLTDGGLPADLLPAVATTSQLAKFLQTSPASLAQDRYRGKGIPFVKISGRVRYLREDVVAYFAANRMQRTDDPRGRGDAA